MATHNSQTSTAVDITSAPAIRRPHEGLELEGQTPSRPIVSDRLTATDRRRFLRRHSTHLVRVLPYRDIPISPEDLEWALHESPLRGQMLDISMNGVAFLLKQPLAVSARVWLKLESRTRDFAVVRSGRIIRVVSASDTASTVTCRFDHCVPYADVVLLSQQLF